MTAVFRREMGAYFHGVTGYLFMAFVLVFAGIYTMVYNLSGLYANDVYKRQRRTFDRLDASTKQKILCRAKADIRNLFFCMEPLEAELTVWRNVPESLCAGHNSGQQLDWQAFSLSLIHI